MEVLDESKLEFENGYHLRYKNGGVITTETEWSDPSVVLSHYRLIKALKKNYVFDNPDEIGTFLFSNSFLQDVLLEAPEYIYGIFGRVSLHLELLFDPESSTEELFILIKSPYPISDSVKLEKQLFEEWFYYKIDSTRGQLTIAEVPA